MAYIQCQGENVIIGGFSTIQVYTPESSFSLKIPLPALGNNSKSSNETNGRILCMAFSNCGRYFAACNDAKQLAVWDTSQSPWSLLIQRLIARKAVSVCLLGSSKLLVADKAGDVYEIDFLSKIGESVLIPIMGHISMLLDMVLSKDEKLLVTCDRDEKIRISHFPNCYNIKCYCLGHTEYVIKVFIVPNFPEVLVSGSGDGTVRFWSLKDGTELEKIICEKYLSGVESTFVVNNRTTDVKPESSKEGPHSSKDACIAAVKSLKYSVSSSVLAVLFTAFNTISLFKVEAGSTITYKHLQNLNFTHEIWDATFDADGMLWVLLANQNDILTIYHPVVADKTQFEKLVDMPCHIQRLVSLIKDDWEFFKDSLNVKDEHYTLYKQWYDNVKVYYEKKEERLNSVKKKKIAT